MVDVSFVVRSKEDPMLEAKKLSSNSFDFGFSTHDLRAIGFIGLFISLLMVFRPCIVICSIRRIPRYEELERQAAQGIVADPELESVIRRRRLYQQQADLDESQTTLQHTGRTRDNR